MNISSDLVESVYLYVASCGPKTRRYSPRPGVAKNANLAFLTVVLVAASVALTAQTQSNGVVQKTSAYKLGQVWTMQQGITVTILAMENLPKIGRIVHVRVGDIPWGSCGDIHLTRVIEHIAVTEKMMLVSGLALSKENVALPESSIEVLRQWQALKPKKRPMWQAPLPQIIRAQGYVLSPISCDSFPELRGD